MFVLFVNGCAYKPDNSVQHITFEKHFDNFPKSKKHIRKIVNHCWTISENLRSKPGLDPMTYGQYLTATCFENEYIKLFLIVNIRHDQKTKEALEEQFKNLRRLVIEDIYQDINNISGISNASVLSSATSYTFLAQDIFMDLAYEIHRNYHSHTYPSGNLIKAIEYLDNFTP